MSFTNQQYQGPAGRVLLQLSKTYKCDPRFKLDNRFKDDLQVSKLPTKLKQIADKSIMQQVKKVHKIIKKTNTKPLIIHRFQPGTRQAQINIKRAQKQKNMYKQFKKNKNNNNNKQITIKKGINKVKKAEMLLNNNNKNQNNSHPTHQFKITVNGNRKQAFKQTDFKLFG